MAHATHHIQADHVALILAFRKANPRTRWHALSNGLEAGDCGGSWRNSHQHRTYLELSPQALRSRVSCLWHGDLARTIKKVQLIGGSKEVKRTWGVGFKALMAEINGKGVQ